MFDQLEKMCLWKLAVGFLVLFVTESAWGRMGGVGSTTMRALELAETYGDFSDCAESTAYPAGACRAVAPLRLYVAAAVSVDLRPRLGTSNDLSALLGSPTINIDITLLNKVTAIDLQVSAMHASYE